MDAIDIYDRELMTQELFTERYAMSGQPLVVRNATGDWLARKEFNFNFFKDLYLRLNR